MCASRDGGKEYRIKFSSSALLFLQLEKAQSASGNQNHREPDHGNIAGLRNFGQRHFLIDDGFQIGYTAGHTVAGGRSRGLFFLRRRRITEGNRRFVFFDFVTLSDASDESSEAFSEDASEASVPSEEPD